MELVLRNYNERTNRQPPTTYNIQIWCTDRIYYEKEATGRYRLKDTEESHSLISKEET